MRLNTRGLWISFFSLLFFAGKAISQDAARISIDLSDVPFIQFVQETEKISGCHFYFNSNETDSLRITVKSTGVTLSSLLQQALHNTGFQYAVDEQNRVFISRNQIQTSLAAGSFDRKKNTKDTLVEPPLMLSGAQAEKEKRKASLEMKLFEIGTKTNNITKGNAILVGYVRDTRNGEALSGATVYVDTPLVKTITDQFGYFSITLPKGRHTLRVNSVGMKDTKRQLLLYSDGKLNIELEDYIASLKAVVVTTERRSNVRCTQMGVDKVNIRTIKQVPTVLGESDILCVVLTLPGVTSVGESST